MRISEALGVSPTKLWNQGVFDSYLGIDSRLHIDPALLRSTTCPEFKKSIDRFSAYFDGVLLMISSAQRGGAIERQAIQKLIFPEIPVAALGFAESSTRGRGVSPPLAARLYATAKEIVDAGVKDPAIFELAVIFEDKFGPDLISDMTLWVILKDVGSFNDRVCKNLRVPVKQVTLDGKSVSAAHSAKCDRSILLLPQSLLAELPEATCWADIDEAVEYNRKIREKLNALLGKNWASLVKKLHKRDLRDILLKNPTLFSELIEQYKAKRPTPYDFDQDPLGEVIWEQVAKDYANKNALTLTQPRSLAELCKTVILITAKFKRLIEHNSLCDHLYTDDGKQRPEKFAQLLFYAVADAYCEANDLDISAEPNAGRGPVDFKISKGYKGRALVELKLSSNSKALDGLLAQLPTYAQAEQSVFNSYVLLVTGRSRTKVDEIVALRNKLLKEKKTVPDLVVINAYEAHRSPSASKLSLKSRFRF
jgi:hypothetical protein